MSPDHMGQPKHQTFKVSHFILIQDSRTFPQKRGKKKRKKAGTHEQCCSWYSLGHVENLNRPFSNPRLYRVLKIDPTHFLPNIYTTMSGAAGVQALKRIPRIKFPQRHPKQSASGNFP